MAQSNVVCDVKIAGFAAINEGLTSKTVTPEEALVQRLVYPDLINFKDSKGLSSDLSLAAPNHPELGVDYELVSISSGTERVQHELRGVFVEFRGYGAYQVGGARKKGGATDGLKFQ